MADALHQVVFFQNIVAEEAAGLALAADVGYPVEFAVGKQTEAVDEVAPVGVCHEHPVIADALEGVKLVGMHPGFPGPFTDGGAVAGGVVERQAVREFWEARFFASVQFARTPLDGGTHRHIVGLFGGRRFAELVAPLASDPIVGSGEKSYRAVAGSVTEEGRAETRRAAAEGLDPAYGENLAVGSRLYSVDVEV